MKTDDLQMQVNALRGALNGLINATAAHNGIRAHKARMIAIDAYIDTTPNAVQKMCLELAQSRMPSIKTFSDAIKHYGTMLILEAVEAEHAQN